MKFSFVEKTCGALIRRVFNNYQACTLLQEIVIWLSSPKFICRNLIHQNHCCGNDCRGNDDFKMTFTHDLFRVVLESDDFVFKVSILQKEKKNEIGYGPLKNSGE